MTPELRTLLLAAAVQLHREGRLFPITLSAECGDGQVEPVVVRFTRHEILTAAGQTLAGEPTPPVSRGTGPRLAKIHAQIYLKSGTTPVTPIRLLEMAGYEYNSYGRGAVATLLKRGHLAKVLSGGVVRGPVPLDPNQLVVEGD